MRNTARFSAMALTLAGTLALSALPVQAASSGSDIDQDNAGALCTRLSDQFNNLKPFKEGLPYWQNASAEFATGKADCAAGKPVAGAKSMRQAISDLYVKPDTL
tara:strand:+ start:13467 stop:13778 length:312 start_codon:yes stop_codon:yes gene_type:complete